VGRLTGQARSNLLNTAIAQPPNLVLVYDCMLRHALTLICATCLAAAIPAAEPGFTMETDGPVFLGRINSIPISIHDGPAELAGFHFTLIFPTETLVRLDQEPTVSLAFEGRESWTTETSSRTLGKGDLELTFLATRNSGGALIETNISAPVAYVHMRVRNDSLTGEPYQIVFRGEAAGFGEDPTRALLSITDSAGESIVADNNGDGFRDADIERPEAEVVPFTSPTGEFPVVADFAPDGGLDAFKYFQILPTFDTPGTKLVGASAPGTGFSVTLADSTGLEESPSNTFLGIYLPPYTDPQWAAGGYVMPPTGSLLRARWLVESTAATAADSPILETSLGSSDNNLLARAIFQRTGFDANVTNSTVPTAGDSRVLEVITYVPDLVNDAGVPENPDGMYPMFATLTREGQGTQGTAVTLSALDMDVIPLGDLGAPRLEFAQNFVQDGVGPFIASKDNPLPGAQPVGYTTDGSGLGVRLQHGARMGDPDSYGYFHTGESATFIADASRLYLATVTFGTSSTTQDHTPAQSIGFFAAREFDYGYVSDVRALTDAQHQPTSDADAVHTVWLRFPPEVDGRSIIVGLAAWGDPWQLGEEAIYYRSITVQSFPAPPD
jgi:hypothetical protein